MVDNVLNILGIWRYIVFLCFLYGFRNLYCLLCDGQSLLCTVLHLDLPSSTRTFQFAWYNFAGKIHMLNQYDYKSALQDLLIHWLSSRSTQNKFSGGGSCPRSEEIGMWVCQNFPPFLRNCVGRGKWCLRRYFGLLFLADFLSVSDSFTLASW